MVDQGIGEFKSCINSSGMFNDYPRHQIIHQSTNLSSTTQKWSSCIADRNDIDPSCAVEYLWELWHLITSNNLDDWVRDNLVAAVRLSLIRDHDCLARCHRRFPSNVVQHVGLPGLNSAAHSEALDGEGH